MARAPKPASGKAAAKKPAAAPAARKAAVAPVAAGTPSETGATAPVSLSVDLAKAAPPAPTNTAPEAPALQDFVVIGARAVFPGMGRFPVDWKPTQTPEKSEPEQALQSPAWQLPDIAQFPAVLTLFNNTRNILVVRPLCVRLTQYSRVTVECPTARHYEVIEHDLSARAIRERWDSDNGLQVTHEED